MAAREGGGQQQRNARKAEHDEEIVDVRTDEAAQEHKEELDEDVDSILDEIDEVLETNSEEFVRSFVQKGGE